MSCYRIIIAACSLLLYSLPTMTIADEIITTIKNPNNSCDYLIVTPPEFIDGAVRLAKHRNDYPHDYVTDAHVVILDSIYSGFTTSDTISKHEIIWHGLKWMYENWQEPFDYLVLMGDDSLVVDMTDSTAESFGRMPTFIKEVKVYSGNYRIYFSDDWYTTLGCDTPTTSLDELYNVPLVTGRIPCETDRHCNAYVEKVVVFDLHAPKGAWRNKVLLCADDAYQGAGPDFIKHWESTEKIANNYMPDYFQSKCYLSKFPKDNIGHKPEASSYFFKHINNGSLWTIFYGHGAHHALTDEYILTKDMTSRFDNTKMPTVLLAFTVGNGSYHLPHSHSMCKQFLLLPEGGCLAYIASPLPTYASANDYFGSEIFKVLNTFPPRSIGKKIYQAKKSMPSKNYCLSYTVLGDPALTPSKYFQTLRLIVNETNNRPTSMTGIVLTTTPFTGNYHCTFSIQEMDTINEGDVNVIYKKDSVITSGQDSFITSFEVPIPDAISTHDLKFVTYVWDRLSEGRADTIILSGSADIKKQHSSIGKHASIILRDGRLMLNYIANSNDHMTKVEIFNIRGQKVFTLPIQPSTPGISINLHKQNISPGHYLVRVSTKKMSFNKRMMFMK